VNDDSGAVNDRLNASRPELCDCSADKIDNRTGFRDFFATTELREFAPDKVENERTRQVHRA
jgi:hypothetical protein